MSSRVGPKKASQKKPAKKSRFKPPQIWPEMAGFFGFFLKIWFFVAFFQYFVF